MAITETEQASPPRSQLRLPSLEIRNFRAFDHLKIESLGRVNLITGRNSVGKTSVLEAAYLYARGGAALPLHELLRSRDEFAASAALELQDEGWSGASEREPTIHPLTIKHLFHGRNDFDDFPDPICIGPVGESEEALHVGARWYQVSKARDPQGFETTRFMALSPDDLKSSIGAIPHLSVKMGQGPEAYYSIVQLSDRGSYALRMGSLARDKYALFVKANGLDSNLIALLWNNIQLRPQEDHVRSALQFVAPGVERVSIRIDPEMPGPIPIVAVKGCNQPFPLRTMGDGMFRLFGMVLALVNAQNGFLLLDEIENGLHYSIQPDVWRMIFRVAGSLNVQVFATTHSWDCIEAFQQAAAEAAEDDGMLVRLEELRGKIVATSFDRNDLAVITRDYLEVR
jgi:hypothetical protein